MFYQMNSRKKTLWTAINLIQPQINNQKENQLNWSKEQQNLDVSEKQLNKSINLIYLQPFNEITWDKKIP